MSAKSSAPRLLESPGGALRRALTFAALVLAAFWLWSAWCRFPDEFWNDMRVGAAVALARGFDVYPTAHEGVVTTWTYGPLPLLALLPAAAAREPAGALLIAGLLNLAMIVGGIAFACHAWPGGARGRERLGATALATAAALLFWPESPLRCYYADTLAVACGLVSSTLLVQPGESRRRLWLAALLGAATLACKQTALGIPVAQVAWLWLARGPRAALAHLGRGIAAGVALGGAALLWFDWPALRFVLIELPAAFPATPDPLARFDLLAGPLAVQIGLPLLALAVAPRFFVGRTAPLLLPLLLWALSLPLGVAALLRLGGGLNSLHGFQLWLPPVLVALLHAHNPSPRAWIRLGLAVVALGVGTARVHRAPVLAVTPQTATIEQGTALAREFPQRIWFPLNPLISLYADGRYYCDEDGIYARNAAGRPVTLAQLAPHLPPRWSAIALRYRRDAAWGTAENMIPKNARTLDYGPWRLSVWAPLKSP